MAVHSPHNLSRAVSFVDLTAALLKSQNSPFKMHYSREGLLACRSEIASTLNHDVAKASAEDAGCPKPPPSTPHDPTTTTNDQVNQTAADLAEFELNESGVQIVPEGSGALKKKKKKSSGINKKPKPTGFEEFYADKPLTPAEHKEESALYDESVPFCQRIEMCMQKYRAKRNLDSTRNNILTKYFMLGGIDATPRAFTGSLDKETIQNSTAEEIRTMTATDFIRPGSKKYYDPEEPENWVVDFEGVAKGFFSERVPLLFRVDRQEDIILYSSVIRNFLNYVLAHDVCPEYNDDVMAARGICRKAEKELWACQLLRWEFPGDFNMAASTLYSGIYKGMHVTTQTWEQEDPENEKWLKLSPGMSEGQAERIFKTAIAFEGDDKMFALVDAGDVHVVNTDIRYVEIIKIIRASEKTVQLYSTVKDSSGVTGKIKALGSLVLRPWGGPGTEEYESAGNSSKEDSATSDSTSLQSETVIWLEDDILEVLFEGMKMEVTLHELNVGVTYMDTLGGPYCSFYQSMENEKMVDWKEPVPNTRPAPNEDNPNIEEDALNSEMDGNFKNDEKVSISNNEVQNAIEQGQEAAISSSN